MAMDPEIKALNACIRELDKLETAAARTRIASFVFARYTLGGNTDDDPIERMWRSKKLRHAFLRALSDLPNGPIGEPGCRCYVDEDGLHAADCHLHGDEADRRNAAAGRARASAQAPTDAAHTPSRAMGADPRQMTVEEALGPSRNDYCRGCGQDKESDGTCSYCDDPLAVVLGEPIESLAAKHSEDDDDMEVEL